MNFACKNDYFVLSSGWDKKRFFIWKFNLIWQYQKLIFAFSQIDLHGVATYYIFPYFYEFLKFGVKKLTIASFFLNCTLHWEFIKIIWIFSTSNIYRDYSGIGTILPFEWNTNVLLRTYYKLLRASNKKIKIFLDIYSLLII